jgi:hypothetical protein
MIYLRYRVDRSVDVGGVLTSVASADVGDMGVDLQLEVS